MPGKGPVQHRLLVAQGPFAALGPLSAQIASDNAIRRSARAAAAVVNDALAGREPSDATSEEVNLEDFLEDVPEDESMDEESSDDDDLGLNVTSNQAAYTHEPEDDSEQDEEHENVQNNTQPIYYAAPAVLAAFPAPVPVSATGTAASTAATAGQNLQDLIPCMYCDREFSSTSARHQHALDRHIGTICHWPSCGTVTDTEDELIQHFLEHQRVGIEQGWEKTACAWPNCGKSFSRERIILVRRDSIGLHNVSLPGYVVVIAAKIEAQLTCQEIPPTTHPKAPATPDFHTTTQTSLLKFSVHPTVAPHNAITEHCAAFIVSYPALQGTVSTALATTAKQSKAAASASMSLVADAGRKAAGWAAANPGKTAAMAAGAVLIAAPMAAMAPVLGAAGFGANGIVAGSVAAGVQSSIGSVGAGSLFATLTSAGAGGSGVAAASIGAQVVAGVGAASAGLMSIFGKKKNQEGEDAAAEKSEEHVLDENDDDGSRIHKGNH
ncbi:hypothetical protein F4782DRAFT_536438 [Xylaria castorea]|nr:hypothetical protein F4782DRAFT_536438 [Xylaria castorea]